MTLATQKEFSVYFSDHLPDIELVTHDQLLKDKGVSGLGNHSNKVLGVIYPKDSNEVQNIISVASQLNVTIYPVSCGNNWGYGRSCPPKENSFILDMRKMNRILDFDNELGSVEIEPGVTQGQLSEYLSNSNWIIDCTGAGPNTSIIGNILERGFGHSPLGYRSRHFSVTEFVASNGELYSFSSSKKHIGRSGLSAGIHEIFTQNNLGVVTKVRYELVRRPDASLRCIVKLTAKSSIRSYIDIMRELKSEGTVDALPHIANHYRMLGMYTQFDFESWNPKTTASNEDISSLMKQFNISPWMATFSIFGCSSVAKAKAKRVKNKLKHIAKVYIIPYRYFEKALSVSKFLSTYTRWIPNISSIHERTEEIKNAMGIFEGKPDYVAIKGCYWRNKKKPDLMQDPITNGCGFYWLAPTLPLIGSDVGMCLDITEKELNRSGFELAVTLTAVTSSLCQAVISVYYDTTNADEIERACATVKKLRKIYLQKDWVPYRRSVDEMPIRESIEKDALKFRKKIKQAFDPNNIIAPGRYES